MKLAEALLLRADLQKRIEQIESRLLRNAKVQEGETPAEDPQALLAELSDLVRQLETLMRRINETNAALTDAGETMTALLARRDCLRLYVQALRRFCAEASETVMRGTRSEVVVRSAVDVRRLQKTIDDTSKELRELDLRIQGLNWTAELQ
ncbi:MAG: DIP1984 family protein [Eubacteriales bacterium]|nr:DIP1984 family protein [Eubacteriales bacterium]